MFMRIYIYLLSVSSTQKDRYNAPFYENMIVQHDTLSNPKFSEIAAQYSMTFLATILEM